MKKELFICLVLFCALVAFRPEAAAQTNVVIETNVVTLTITNVITVTNIVTQTPAATNAESVVSTNKVVQPAKNPWESSITIGLTLTSGNSKTLLMTGGVKTHKKTPDNELTFEADGAYGTSGGTEDVNMIHGFGQFNHLFSKKFYAYARVEGLRDGIADLQYRITVGPGAGYYFIKETNTTFSSELGSSFVTQRLGQEDKHYATLRLAESFEHKFKSYGARIWENVEVLPQVDQFNNYLINTEVGIESALGKSLSLKTFVVDNFNNEPASDREKNDLKLVSAISYKF
jgi:putative salt-induced outer membrane protein YdiY